MTPDELAALIEQVLNAQTDEARQAVFANVTDLDATEAEWSSFGLRLIEKDPTDEDYEAAAMLDAALTHLRAERDRRNEIASAAETRREEMAARFRGAKAEDDAESDDKDEKPTAEEPGEEQELAADTKTEDEPAEAPAEPEAPAAPAEPPPARAVARVPIEALARAVPEDAQAPETERAPLVKVSAAVDLPGWRPGQTFEAGRREIAEAIVARQDVIGRTRGGTVAMEKIPVVHFNYEDTLPSLGDDKMFAGLKLMDIGNHPPGIGELDAILASGGFCAPAQVVYDFVKVNKPSDLTQDFLPVVGAPRGSIEYPDSPDIRDGFTAHLSRGYSNQNDIDGVVKVTAVIACPSFNTCTVGAEYVILQFGNFGTRAYPEWVEHWVGLAMDVHAHNVSSKLINQMVALSNAVVPVGPNGGATSTILSNLAMAAADYRYDLGMDKDATLEVVLPSWTQDLIQSDMARARKGQPSETLSISDPTIDGWIRNLDLNVHYVRDWQQTSGLNSVGASAWPLGLDFLMYAPGTFVKLDMGTLDLGIVRDSVLNETNDYNIFVESFESACRPGIESRLYSVSICANGAFSADQNLDCTGVDIPSS